MRDIIFCGKRVDGINWIEGFYVQVNSEAYISLPLGVSESCTVTAFDEQQTEVCLCTLAPFVKVIPETIGQFTERFDRNYVRIFEHHIIKACGDGHSFCGEVTYSKETSSYWVENDRLEIYAELCNLKSEFIEIIGNAYDNPALL